MSSLYLFFMLSNSYSSEQHLIEYAAEQNKPSYQQQFRFGPYYTREGIDQLKEELKNLPTDFETPLRYNK